MAKLFNTSHDNISLQLEGIFEDGQLSRHAVVKELVSSTENAEHLGCDGRRPTFMYNLEAILAVGMRVETPSARQLRQHFNSLIKEYVVKGFIMDDNRPSQTERWDYFDEWLARIRDIRTSEKRFYQKVRDLYATAADYDGASEQAQLFFDMLQSKMLWAVTRMTAAELIADRSDLDKGNMGLTSFKGGIVRKGDVGTAKNYHGKEKIESLNRIVTMYLDYAEEQVQNRKSAEAIAE